MIWEWNMWTSVCVDCERLVWQEAGIRGHEHWRFATPTSDCRTKRWNKRAIYWTSRQLPFVFSSRILHCLVTSSFTTGNLS